MKEFKGTNKAQWERKGTKVGIHFDDPMKQETICQVYGSGEETNANTKLISAAPTLLEAAQKAQDVLDKLYGWYNKQPEVMFPDDLAIAIDNADILLRNAINRTLGE